MGVAADTELDQDWSCENAQIQAPMRHPACEATPQACNWSRAGSGERRLATNPTLPCAFSLGWCETDQYLDPWRDLGLSMDPTNRQRSLYAGGNPISNVDLDGHKICAFGICTTIDEKIAAGVDHVVNSVRVATGGQAQPVVRRSILPVGSVGPVAVTTPSMVDLSSQITPYPGVSEEDRAQAMVDAGYPLTAASALFAAFEHDLTLQGNRSIKFVTRGVPRKGPMLHDRAAALRAYGHLTSGASVGYETLDICVRAKSASHCASGASWSAGSAWAGTKLSARACGGIQRPRRGAACAFAMTTAGGLGGGEVVRNMALAMNQDVSHINRLRGQCNDGNLGSCFAYGWGVGVVINDG